MHRANPFSLPGHWFRGCLHLHTTASDGRMAAEEIIAWYQSWGYHFLALTDHFVWSDGRVVDERFITLGGVEVDGVDPRSGLFHLVALGTQRPPGLRRGVLTSMQEAIDRLRDAGSLVIVAHPYWSGQMSRDLSEVEGCIGLEVYNGGCDVDDAKGLSTVHWDDLLAAGCRLWGLAVDDAHWRDGDHDAGLGWVWVKAEELTQAAILGALERGHFYASSGPEIYDLTLEGGRVHVRCSPTVAIDFVGNGHLSRRIMAPAGGALTEASYRLQTGQRYVRVACRDARDRWAWSNPIFPDEIKQG